MIDRFLESSFFSSVKFGITLSFIANFVAMLFNDGFSELMFFRVTVACFGISFAVLLFENLGIVLERLWSAWSWVYARAEAAVEIAGNKDYNRSGAKGDVVPEVVHHFVKTNVPTPEKIDGSILTKDKLVQFIHRQAIIGIRREHWLKEQWEDGSDVTQKEYEAAIKFLDEVAHAIRGSRNNRKIIYAPEDLITSLNL